MEGATSGRILAASVKSTSARLLELAMSPCQPMSLLEGRGIGKSYGGGMVKLD